MSALIVLMMFILFITADYIIRRVRRAAPAASDVQTIAGPLRGLNLQDFRVPKGVFFHPGHTWAALQPRGNVWLGVDDFVQKLTGSVQAVQTPEVGSRIKRGDPFLTLEVDDRKLCLLAPFSGKVAAINPQLLGHLPDLGWNAMNREWFVDLEPDRLSEEISQLLVADKAIDWLRREIERFKEFLDAQAGRPSLAGVTLPDGGEPAFGVLNLLDKEGWQTFQKNFLN